MALAFSGEDGTPLGRLWGSDLAEGIAAGNGRLFWRTFADDPRSAAPSPPASYIVATLPGVPLPLWRTRVADADLGPAWLLPGGGRLWVVSPSAAVALDPRTGKQLDRLPGEIIDARAWRDRALILLRPAGTERNSPTSLHILDMATGAEILHDDAGVRGTRFGPALAIGDDVLVVSTTQGTRAYRLRAIGP